MVMDYEKQCKISAKAHKCFKLLNWEYFSLFSHMQNAFLKDLGNLQITKLPLMKMIAYRK